MTEIASETPAAVVYGPPEVVREVEAFLAYETELLDEWRLDEWLSLFTPDAEYLVPTTDLPDGDPERDLFFVRDDYFLLSQRVAALMDGTAWTESPRSTRVRMISGVRAFEPEPGVVTVKANFVVYRSRVDRLLTYPGRLELELVRGGPAGFEIRRRVAKLAMEQLRPHGRVSIIL